jgi:tetratricopeptide (TPR) repeat protein
LTRLNAQKRYKEVIVRASGLRGQLRGQLSSRPGREAYVLASRSQADVHVQLGQLEQAAPLFKEALDLTKKSQPPNTAALENALNAIAEFSQKSNDNDGAARYLGELLQIKTAQRNDDEIARLSNNLAAIYARLGQNTLAEESYKRALDVYAKKHGNDNSGTALYLNNLGTFYHNVGRLHDAAAMNKRALDVVKSLSDKQAIATFSNNLASVYQLLGRFDEAEALLKLP